MYHNSISNHVNQDFGAEWVIMIHATIKLLCLHVSLSCTLLGSHTHYKFKITVLIKLAYLPLVQ